MAVTAALSPSSLPQSSTGRLDVRSAVSYTHLGFARLTVGGKQVAMAFGGGGGEISSSVGRVHLEKGRKVALEISYGSRDGKPHAELIWTKYSSAPSPEAIAAAKDADAVIAVVGITCLLYTSRQRQNRCHETQKERKPALHTSLLRPER